MGTTLEDVAPETAARIAAQAKTHGLSVDEYLSSLLPDASDRSEKKAWSADEKATRWREWVAGHSIKGVAADDGRECFYTREDEAL